MCAVRWKRRAVIMLAVRCSFKECTAILMVDGCVLYTFHSPANGRVSHVTVSSSQQHQLILGEEDVFITGQSFHIVE